jgi:hypothetical protein
MHLNPRSTAAFAATAFLILGASSAQARSTADATTPASCANWNVTGIWKSAASNNYHVTFRFVQKGNKLTGTATNPPGEAAIAGYATGSLTGSVKGNHFRIIVIWAPRTSDHVQLHGLYVGTVTKNAITDGLGTDLTTKPTPPPASWSATGPSKCVKS